MNFHIITIFPKIFDSYFNESIIKRARKSGLVSVLSYDLRNWTDDRHRTVDDKPFGGGAGMVLKAEPILKALEHVRKKCSKNTRAILFSAKGKVWSQKKANLYSKKYDDIIMICGRYEGVDERILKFVDEEISIGEYVLTGGEIPAMIVVDSITRLMPGALGNDQSAAFESFQIDGALEHPHYTRPEILSLGGKRMKVPKVLLSGNHRKINEWRERKRKKAAGNK